jgi:DNA-binding protein HU-beta
MVNFSNEIIRRIFMNKSELISALAAKSDLTKKDAEKMLNNFEVIVKEELAAGRKIQIVGFMTLDVSERAEREGRNPQTGAPMTNPASKAVKFSAGKALKDAVNGK